jgi:hypothetical protein
MRVLSLINYRTSFLFAGLLCFASAVVPRPLNNPPLIDSRREPMNEFVVTQGPKPASSAGDFSISANPTALTIPINAISPSAFADGTITLTGQNGFSGNVQLTCVVMGGTGQNQPTCFFPALFPSTELFVDASSGASATSIEADGVTPMCSPPIFCAVPSIFGGGSGIFAEAGLALMLLAFSVCFAMSLPKRFSAQILCAAMICGAGLVAAGCSSGPSGAIAEGCAPGLAFTPGTPAGTYTMTVVGTSGSLTHSVMIPVTVPAQ